MSRRVDEHFASLDSAVWEEWDGDSFSTGSQGVSGGVYLVTFGTESNGDREAGIVLKATNDVSAPAACGFKITTNDNSTWIYWSLTKPVDENGAIPQESEADWYRGGNFGGTYILQRKVGGGSITSLGSGTAASLPATYDLVFPRTGDEVRLLENDFEVASDGTYQLGSRTGHAGGAVYSDVDNDQGAFDDFYLDDAIGAVPFRPPPLSQPLMRF